MAAIPGWAYALSGSVVAGFSKFVEVKTGKNMGLFFFAGLLFIGIGIIKIAYAFVKAKVSKDNNPDPVRKSHPQSSQKHQGLQAQAPQRGAQHHVKPQARNAPQDHATLHNIINCPRCGARHYSYANFCMSCGYRLK